MVPVLVPEFVPVVPDPVLVAAFGPGKSVAVPSTWICPPVALVRMAIVWPEVVRPRPPGVKVTVPATKLVGLPVKVIPSIVYVEGAAAFVFVYVLIPVFVDVPAPVIVLALVPVPVAVCETAPVPAPV